MANCIVPGCPLDATNNLGVRLRRPNTSAIWAPNTEAFVCDKHAVSGARLTIHYEATSSGDVEVIVSGVTDPLSRVTSINVDHEPVAELMQQIQNRE
jgi:hypothetical protein